MDVRDADLRVVGDTGVALDAAIDLESDSGAAVIVLRARYANRNRDHNRALETILSRSSRAGIRSIAVQVASPETRDQLDDAERLVRVDVSPVIELGGRTAAELRRLIGRSVAATDRRPTGEKERARSGGGNSTKRLLIDAGIGRSSRDSAVRCCLRTDTAVTRRRNALRARMQGEGNAVVLSVLRRGGWDDTLVAANFFADQKLLNDLLTEPHETNLECFREWRECAAV